MVTTFFVPGTPVAKGSAKAFYRAGMKHAVVLQDNAELQKPWASLISVLAGQAGLTPRTEGCSLGLTFHMPRPKSHLRANGEVKDRAHIAHTKKPDIDKLVRCVLDALTGIAYADDSQVARVEAIKRYANDGRHGCAIEVEYES
jgi:crossover junction endodeoxyribonuclease RusA